MHLADQVHGMQGIHLARAGGTTTLIHSTHCATFTQNDGATGESRIILGMSDQDTWYIGDGIVQFHHPP